MAIGYTTQKHHTWEQIGIGYGAHVVCSHCKALLKNKHAPCMAVMVKEI